MALSPAPITLTWATTIWPPGLADPAAPAAARALIRQYPQLLLERPGLPLAAPLWTPGRPGHVAIVGRAGAGKTGALCLWAARLLAAGAAVVLSVGAGDDLTALATTLPRLARVRGSSVRTARTARTVAWDAVAHTPLSRSRGALTLVVGGLQRADPRPDDVGALVARCAAAPSGSVAPLVLMLDDAPAVLGLAAGATAPAVYRRAASRGVSLWMALREDDWARAIAPAPTRVLEQVGTLALFGHGHGALEGTVDGPLGASLTQLRPGELALCAPRAPDGARSVRFGRVTATPREASVLVLRAPPAMRPDPSPAPARPPASPPARSAPCVPLVVPPPDRRPSRRPRRCATSHPCCS